MSSKGDWLVAFGGGVRKARTNKGLTQETLGNRTGLGQSFMSEVESGKRNPSIWTMKVIADALDTSVSELVRLGETA